MTKEERAAMQMALKQLKYWVDHSDCPEDKQAITVIEKCLANDALEKKAENAREIRLDYEPVKYDCCANCMRPQHEHNGNSCPKPYTTVRHAWDYDFSPYPALAVKHVQPEQEPCCYGGIAHDCHAGDGCRIAERIKAAQATEREACAQVCDDMMRSYWNTADDEGPDPDDCAKAIRARGEASIRRQA